MLGWNVVHALWMFMEQWSMTGKMFQVVDVPESISVVGLTLQDHILG